MTNTLGVFVRRVQGLVWGSSELDGLPWAGSRAIQFLRYLHVTLRDLTSGDLVMRAGSLAYTTLLSFVPLLAVSFALLKGFGVHNQIEPALARMLAPLGDKAQELTVGIVGFVENMKVGALGAVGLALLVYTVVSTMQKIENAFNHSWRVTAQRRLKQRFSDYLSVLIVGPVLVFSALGITGAVTQNRVVDYLSGFQVFGTLLEWLSRLIPYAMIIGAFTFIYLFMPNTRVRFRSALFGGVVGGVLWQSAGWGFARFVAGSAQYTAVYSAFASVMILFIWIYAAWLILLTGANIAFYHQHPEYLCLKQREPRLSLREREILALGICKLVSQRHYAGHEPWTVNTLSRHLLIPKVLIEQATNALEQAGLLARRVGAEAAFLPAQPLERTSVAQVLSAVRGIDDEGLVSDRLAEWDEVADLLQSAEQASTDVLKSRMLSELARPVAKGG